MRVKVRVKANAKEAKIEKLSENSFSIWVKERPKEGRANYAVREALSDYFKLSRSRVILIKGEKGKEKIFEIIS